MYITTPLVKNDKGCFMFTVQPLSKVIILSMTIYIILIINIAGDDRILSGLSIVFIIWLYRYLTTLKVHLNESYLVKYNGKTFKHKTILMLKNISRVEFLILHAEIPAVVRVHTYDKSLFLFGLNGRQRLMLEHQLMQLK